MEHLDKKDLIWKATRRAKDRQLQRTIRAKIDKEAEKKLRDNREMSNEEYYAFIEKRFNEEYDKATINDKPEDIDREMGISKHLRQCFACRKAYQDLLG